MAQSQPAVFSVLDHCELLRSGCVVFRVLWAYRGFILPFRVASTDLHQLSSAVATF